MPCKGTTKAACARFQEFEEKKESKSLSKLEEEEINVHFWKYVVLGRGGTRDLKSSLWYHRAHHPSLFWSLIQMIRTWLFASNRPSYSS